MFKRKKCGVSNALAFTAPLHFHHPYVPNTLKYPNGNALLFAIPNLTWSLKGEFSFSWHLLRTGVMLTSTPRDAKYFQSAVRVHLCPSGSVGSHMLEMNLEEFWVGLLNTMINISLWSPWSSWSSSSSLSASWYFLPCLHQSLSHVSCYPLSSLDLV